MTKSDPVGTLSPVRCTRCGEVNMRRDDDGYHACRTCGKLMSEAEHDRAFDEQAAAQEAAELAEETPVRGPAR
jgi:ribosomal protein L37AE/L43A